MKLCYFLDFALAQLVHTVFVASTFSTECTTVVNQIQNIEMVLENGEVQLGHRCCNSGIILSRGQSVFIWIIFQIPVQACMPILSYTVSSARNSLRYDAKQP